MEVGCLGAGELALSPGMPEGELFWGDRPNLIFGYFIGGGDEYMGLAGGLNTKGGPWTSRPWLVTWAWCAGDALRLLQSHSEMYRHSATLIINHLVLLSLRIIFHLPVFFPNWESTRGRK